MIGSLLLWTGLTLILYGIYKWITANDKFFEKRSVPYLKPTFLFGNIGAFIFQTTSLPDFAKRLYANYPTKKFFGMFDFRKPFYFIRDPEMVKLLAVKDFDHFEDHRSFVDESVDTLFGNSLFMLKGEKWRDMRATLSPAFTGSKMRQMFELVSECADEMSEYFKKQVQGNGKKCIDFEMKELFSKYTNDVISSIAFGIKTNSFENVNNDFFRAGQKFKDISSPLSGLKMVIMKAFPSLAKMFGISFFDVTTRNFFRSMVLENISIREKEGIYRPDMINILKCVRNGVNLQNSIEEKHADGFATVEESSIGKIAVKREWSDDEIVAQCFLFFLAGFDTTSTCLAFVSYELAIHSDCQEKLYKEVYETNKLLGGKRLTYDALQKMKYMDMVISESLRRWPPVAIVDRECVKDYEYDDSEIKLRIDKGTAVWIPIYAFHHDERFFHNPDIYDPERFSEENKDNIRPGTYLPFGTGPRNCIGSRFALMEVKAVIYYLLLNFKFEPNLITQIPVRLKRSPFALTPEKGIHLQLKLRE